MSDSEEFNAASQEDFAYLVPAEKFVYRENGVWRLDRAVGRAGIEHYLQMRGWPEDLIATAMKTKNYMIVADVVMTPNEPVMFSDGDGNHYINTWVEPKVKPVKGEYPRIELLLTALTNYDQKGVDWLKNWIALKIQNPEIVPKVAVVLATSPGLGKGTLYFIISTMLGPENCASIDGQALENKFNSRWAQKLFIMADEVLHTENAKNVSDRLKILIDGSAIEFERKGKDQLAVRNRAAWMFASNNQISPVAVEKGDRRYTVFNNHDVLVPEYVSMLNGLFEADRETPTKEFVSEIEAFLYDCLNMKVDRNLVFRPYENDARLALIESNVAAHEAFFREVDEEGIDSWIDKVLHHGQDYTLSRTRTTWDFGANGVSTEIIYQAYVEFCKARGVKGVLKYNKFGVAIKGHRPVWTHKRNGDKRMNCYVVKRSGKALEKANV